VVVEPLTDFQLLGKKPIYEMIVGEPIPKIEIMVEEPLSQLIVGEPLLESEKNDLGIGQ